MAIRICCFLLIDTRLSYISITIAAIQIHLQHTTLLEIAIAIVTVHISKTILSIVHSNIIIQNSRIIIQIQILSIVHVHIHVHVHCFTIIIARIRTISEIIVELVETIVGGISSSSDCSSGFIVTHIATFIAFIQIVILFHSLIILFALIIRIGMQLLFTISRTSLDITLFEIEEGFFEFIYISDLLL